MRLRVRYRISWLMLTIVRVTCLVLIGVAKLCKSLTVQMWYTNRLKQFNESLTRQKKYVIIGTVSLILLLYLWPYWLPVSKSPSSKLLYPHRWLAATKQPLAPAEFCLEAKLEQFRRGVETFDIILNHSPLLPSEKYYLPYVGNGYIGTTLMVKSQLQILRDRVLSFPINFYPVIEISLEGSSLAEAHAIHMLNGVVYRIQSFHLEEEMCIVATTITYADRHRPSLLVQELRIHNPSEKAVTVDIRQIGVSAWSNVNSHHKRVNTGRAAEVEYVIIKGKVQASRSSQDYVIAIANVKLPESVTIKPSVTWTSSALTVVKYELVESTNMNNQTDVELNQLSKRVEQELLDVLNVETKTLRMEHSNVWNTLWNSGFSISRSLASGALNGDKINATMYYVLSQTPSPIFERDRPEKERTELERRLYYPDHCYEGHHTLQNEKMWSDFVKIDDITGSALTWLVTLSKNGCDAMLKAVPRCIQTSSEPSSSSTEAHPNLINVHITDFRADGVIQAMILSYGAFRFSNHHLEFGTHPRDLHRDYFYRRINYGNNTHVNVSVRVGEDNKAQLYVSLDRHTRPYYACDAGCIDPPLDLSRDIINLPVKLTDPVTPILYITDDKEHMEELKLAIHVREIVEAPAHEHHVMVMHKHGHHFNNLPVLFWASIAILIVLFHMFLFKLIYNEYCNSSPEVASSRYGRQRAGRYV